MATGRSLFGGIILEAGNSTKYRTGDWRASVPLFRAKTPPCNDACPAGLNIQGFIYQMVEGNYLEAWEVIKEDSPFPGVCGRVCYHPCETACNRKDFDEPLVIHLLERFAADYAASQRRTPPRLPTPREERVAILGSGPAGLSCAYQLARLGFPVTVYEALSQPGGFLRIGIPDYRLPRDVLDREIADIEALGVKIITGIRVGRDITLEQLLREYSAVFVAVGAHQSLELEIPGEDATGVVHGIEFLRRANQGERDFPWGKGMVAIIGAGNVAMDAARCALRLGAKPVIIYRRSRDEVPAHAEEIAEALAEGAEALFLAAPTRILAEDGQVQGIECIRMELGEPDASGRPRPIPVPGSEFVVEVAGVIPAVGQGAELALLPAGVETQRGWIAALPDGATSYPGLFAGGDVVSGPGMVSQAIGSGKRAARAIAAYLEGRATEVVTPPRVLPFSELNTTYFQPQPHPVLPQQGVSERVGSFIEVNLGFPGSDAAAEAERCFSCGVCNNCGNCWLFCPDVAILTAGREVLGPDLEHCKGCGICARECPRRYIDMADESTLRERV